MKQTAKRIIICLLIACNSINSSPINQKIDFVKYKTKAFEALKYCKLKHLNTDFFFLIDMNVHSGFKRFYVWDFNKNSIVNSFMVSHGCANQSWNNDNTKDTPVFSNEDGSHATSLGKYIIGERSYSQWGIHIKYLLYGMDKTNSNAFKRTIVLHGWDQVTDNEVFPKGTVEGWGCPAVSNNSMREIDSLLRYKKEKTLLWIIN